MLMRSSVLARTLLPDALGDCARPPDFCAGFRPFIYSDPVSIVLFSSPIDELKTSRVEGSRTAFELLGDWVSSSGFSIVYVQDGEP